MLERIRFERELSDLDLREYDQNQDLTPTEREVVVGEQINLNVSGDPRLAGKKIERVEWTVPPRAVKSYVEDSNTALATELSRRDLVREKLTFHWVDAGEKAVKVRVTADGKTTEIVFGFDVKAPKVESFTYEVSKPMIVAEKKFSKTNYRISFGNKTKAGAAWDARVRMPKNFGGSIKDLQTVKMGRKKVQLLVRGSRQTRTLVSMFPGAHGAYQLDLGNTGDGGGCDQKTSVPKYHFLLKVKADESVPFSLAFDTPSDALETLDVGYSVDESFKYFMLFKSDKPNSIWVPLVQAHWFWKAEVFKKDEKWFLKTKPKPDGGMTKIEYASTAEFPFYNFNTCENFWCEIKADKTIDCK